MGLFDPGPYGGAPPWAEAAMLLGSGLVSGGAPGGGGIGGLGPAFASMSQAGNRQAQRARMAKTDKRLEKAEGLQQAKFRYEQEQDLLERQQQWRTAAGLGVPPQMLGPMPGTMEATEAGGGTVTIPETGPQAQAGGIMYDPGAGEASLMPPPPSGLMGEGYFQSLPENVQSVVGPMIAQGDVGEAVRLANSMTKEDTQRKWQADRESMLASKYSQADVDQLVANDMRYKLYKDPESGDTSIFDLLEAKFVTPAEVAARASGPQNEPLPPGGMASVLGATPGQTPPVSPAAVPQVAATPPAGPERVSGVPEIQQGYEETFGISGGWDRFKNTLYDVGTSLGIGGKGLPEAETARATQAITQLNAELERTLTGPIGKRLKMDVERIQDTYFLDPKGLFTGPETQKIKAEETKAFIDSQLDYWAKAAKDKGNTVEQRQDANKQVIQLQHLGDGLGQLLKNWENPYKDYTAEQLGGVDLSTLTEPQHRALAQREKELEARGIGTGGLMN